MSVAVSKSITELFSLCLLLVGCCCWIQVRIFTIWAILLIGGSYVVSGTAGAHRARHGGCNFRIVRDIMRRACAYHSSEKLVGLDELHPSGVGRSPNMLDEVVDHHHHDHQSGSRVKKEIELLYIRRILKECCPNEGCPPLSKFCR